MRDRRAVIFDLDDTLHRERRFVLSGLLEVARVIEGRHGIPVEDTWRVMRRHLRRGGRPTVLQAVCRAHGLPLDEIPGWVLTIRSHSPRLRLPRTSRDVLRQVRAAGYRVGILTNGLPQTQRAKVRALGLFPLVDAVVYADEHAPRGKPDGACFTAVLEALRVPAAGAIFVGDDPLRDIAGARAAGLRTIWLSSGPLRAQAHVIVSSLGAVPTALRLLKEPHAHAS